MPIDPERQKKAKEYARIRHRLWALDLILGTSAMVLVIVIGLNVWLRDIILVMTRNEWISTFLYFTVAIIAYQLLFAPLGYYSGFVLPHRYGLSKQDLRAWLIDELKGLALGIVLGGIVITMIYAVLRLAPDSWWLWASGLMIAFSVVLANLAPVLIMPLFYKFKPLEDAELVRRLTALAEHARTHVRGVYTMVMSEKTTTANAALMGLGNTRRIVLGDTLYEKYSHDEIETILAHELGHQVHRDIAWLLVVQSAVILAGFFVVDIFLRWGVAQLGYSGLGDPATMPLFALALGAFQFVFMPIGNAFSRWRETMADEYALQSTKNAPAFIGAMEKLADQNLGELEPEPWVEILLYDHPPIGKRLEHGKRYLSA
jgi:STE24 endopeptidase